MNKQETDKRQQPRSNYELPITNQEQVKNEERRTVSYFDHLITIAKCVRLHAHALSHQEQQVAHVGVRVCGAAAESVVLTGLVESVAAEVPLIEVDMAAVLQAKVRTAGEHQRQVGVAVAVAVRHAAAKERHRRAKQWLAAQVLRLFESREEVAELLDGEGVVVGEFLHVAFIAAVVAELMPRLGDADLWNGERIAFAAEAERGHARDIRLKGEHHQVIDCAEIVARLSLGNVAVGAFAIGIGDLRQRSIEPRIGSPRADLGLTNRSEVLIEATLVGRSHLLLEPPHFREVVIEHAGFAAQSPSLSCDAALRFLEERREDLTATPHRGKLDTVCGPGERTLRQGNFHGRISRMLCGDFGHLLVHRDGVAFRRADLSAGQPDVDAVVVVAEASRMMQAADRSDDLAVLLQRLERS